MKKIIFTALAGLILTNCFSQEKQHYFGFSGSYTHDNQINNQLLNNYYPYDKDNHNVFELVGEFGFRLKSKNAIGFDLGYYSDIAEYQITATALQAGDYYKNSTSGFIFGPKYCIIKTISEKISFFTDLKLQGQYLSLRNTVSQFNTSTYQSALLKMNGNEFKAGVSIVPGIIFNLSATTGIKLQYGLADIFYSTIKKSKDSDIDFKTLKTWDYGINMRLSEISLGMVFNF